MRRMLAPVSLGLLCALAACRGGAAKNGAGGGGDVTAMPPPTQLPPLDACTGDATLPGPRALRRLTAAQLNATVRDLFRDGSVPQATFLTDTPVLGFTVDAATLVVQGLAAQQLADFADQVATWVDAHPSSVTSCTTSDAACRKSFITSFGKRAFRAPLGDAQLAAYDGLFTSQASFADGVHAVVEAMLQSPYFLYRTELGTPSATHPGRYELTPYEIASSLSYLLVGSMPDDALLAAADAGQLATPSAIDAQARRLLADARGHDGVVAFMTGWLGLDRVLGAVKDTTYASLTDALRQSMLGESTNLVLDVAFTQKGTLHDLLTAGYTFLDQNLSQHYGIPGASGSGFTKVTLPAGQRDPGILAHGSILTGYATANSSSPVQRGKLVRTRLLCDALPPPPGGVPTPLVPPSGQQTTRQHYEQHEASAPCKGCHTLIDPIGFGFEAYDGIGRHRTTDNGLPVDASGTLADASGSRGFAGLGALGALLADDAAVDTCMTRYWAYYAYGIASWPQDGCTESAIATDARANGSTLTSVLLAIVHAPHFVSRVQDQ